MRPDKCGEYEPIRTPFDPSDISQPIHWLAQPGGEFFYQQGRPVYAAGAMWNLSHWPDRLFTNYWTGEFDGRWVAQVGIDKLIAFVSEMFRVTCSDFGLLTSKKDLKAKNTDKTSVSYKGMTVEETGIPGLYWLNFFSETLANWLGLEGLPKELGGLQRLEEGGVLLRFCESPEHCRDLAVIQKQRTAVGWLGSERFFDIRFPERKAVTWDWSHAPLCDSKSTQ